MCGKHYEIDYLNQISQGWLQFKVRFHSFYSHYWVFLGFFNQNRKTSETIQFNRAVFVKACSKGVPTQLQHLGSTLIMSHNLSLCCTKDNSKCSSCGAESHWLNITTRTYHSFSSSCRNAEGETPFNCSRNHQGDRCNDLGDWGGTIKWLLPRSSCQGVEGLVI